MRLTLVRPHNSIDAEVTSDELPDFLVISGPNGSGKSNLLEAIATGAIAVDGAAARRENDPAFRFFPLAQLVVAAEGESSPAALRESWVQIHQQINSLVQQTRQKNRNLKPGSDELDAAVRRGLVKGRMLSEQAIDELVERSEKRLIDLTEDDFRRYAPILPGLRDPFAMGITEIFLSYHSHRNANRYQQWLKSEKSDFEGQPLTDEEFEAEHGPPPWDLLNVVLADIGLNYEFKGPAGTEDSLPYEVRLVDNATGIEITVAQLSSGEKTLLALALSLYTGDQHGDAIELPKVLLLDEADASLHPSMVQSLLRVVGRTFVTRYSVKVLLATHSPSTVALAPTESLYIMKRTGHPRLSKATRDEALRALTVGIPTLSVSIEHRRQVFVESEYDADCYQELFRLLRSQLDTPFSLEFIPSGKGGQGDEQSVRHLVGSLRGSGNLSVHGIVDRDDRTSAPEGVIFNPHRDSLENLVLDPVVLGAFLLRERIATAESMGLAADRRYFEIDEHEAQLLAKWVTGAIVEPGDDETPVSVRYTGGFSVDVPRFALDLDGHQLESRFVAKFEALKRFRTGLKAQVIRRALADAQHLIPEDVALLFRGVLSA